MLLAFGEYIPGERLFPGLRDWLPPIGEFAPGPGPTTLLKLDGYRMGPQICYESLFPQFVRSLSMLGAQFIVNATNDSWYGTWQEPYQHMYMTLARGVEFRRPVLRVTNTGISTVALAAAKRRFCQQRMVALDMEGLGVRLAFDPHHPVVGQWLVPGLLWTWLSLLLIMGARQNRIRR